MGEITTVSLDLAKSVFQVYAVDAEVTCEAVTRPTMRFVPVKLPAQQPAAIAYFPEARERITSLSTF